MAGAVRFETWMGPSSLLCLFTFGVREYGRVAGDDGFDGVLRVDAIGVVWVDTISYYSDPP